MRKAILLVLCGTLLGGCVVRGYKSYTPAVEPVTTSHVMAMSEAGYADSAILDRIRQHGVERRPTADDLVALNQSGVSKEVQTALLEAPVTEPRPAQESSVVVVEEDPVAIVGFAAFVAYLIGEYAHHRHHKHVHYRGCGH